MAIPSSSLVTIHVDPRRLSDPTSTSFDAVVEEFRQRCLSQPMTREGFERVRAGLDDLRREADARGLDPRPLTILTIKEWQAVSVLPVDLTQEEAEMVAQSLAGLSSQGLSDALDQLNHEFPHIRWFYDGRQIFAR